MLDRNPRTESYGVGRHLGVAAGLAFLLLGGAGGWAATAKLNAAVVGSGLVKVDRELKTVQHLEGGTVAFIHLRPGEAVKAGEPVISLDALPLEGELAIRHAQLADLVARAARLRAERDGLDRPQIPQRYRADAQTLAALAEESTLLDRARRDLATRRSGIAARLTQLRHEAEALSAREEALASRHRVALEKSERSVALVKRGSLSVAQSDEAGAELAAVWGELSETRARLRTNAAQATELSLEDRRLAEGVGLEAQTQLREIEPRIGELEQEVVLITARLERSVIRAPVSGVVNELKVNTIGQVIAPGEMLASIVPEGADLVVEFHVLPTDIDQVAPGQDARLRFSAFNRKTTPELPGVISQVAAAATVDAASGASSFLAQVRLKAPDSLPGRLTLVPGMPVEVYVTTEERTALGYLLQPLRNSLSRSMTEE